MLEQKYIDNLIKLRDWLLEYRETVQNHIDFKNYISLPGDGYYCNHPELFSFSDPDNNISISHFENEECETNCCLIGWAAVSGQFAIPFRYDWYDFTMQYFGADIDDAGVGAYLFDIVHPPSLDEALERINYVIEHGDAPDEWYAQYLDEDII